MQTSMRASQQLAAPSRPSRAVRGVSVVVPRASAQAGAQSAAERQSAAGPEFGRRAGLLALSSLVLAPKAALAAKDTTAVGTYLPSAGVEDFVLFVPDKAKTPSLRAGTVDAASPYRFAIPPAWSEARVSNTQSGNYCQPRCDEPWTEVVFSNDAEGRMELIVSPLKKLTPRKNVKIEDLGTPAEILERIGNFITGSYLDEEDVVAAVSRPNAGQNYYYFEINASYGKVGPHTLTACTTKGDLAYLFIVSANDKQWAKNEARLRKVVDTFVA